MTATDTERHRSYYEGSWRIDLTIRRAVEPLVPAAALGRLMARALDAAGAPAPASIGLILSGDRELASLNEQHLGSRGPTDVLSFPLLPPEAYPPHPGADRRTAAHDDAFPLPPGVRPHLGDIVISVARAIEQAEAGRGGQSGDVRWDPADELRLLTVHGVLHVCGWDHAEPVERRAMRELERRLVSGRSVTRSRGAGPGRVGDPG